MFLLGVLFVALVVGLMFAAADSGTALVLIIGLVGIAIACYQWWNSDKVGDARDAGPRGHARGGARAPRHDRPALRPGRHAEAAGRHRRHATSPTPSPPGARPTGAVVCVTTGIMGKLDAGGARGGAGPRAVPRRPPRRPGDDHRLLGGHRGRDAAPARPVRRPACGRRDTTTAPTFFVVALLVSLIVYAISFFLTPAAVALPRAVRPTGRAPTSPSSPARWPRRCRRSPARSPPIPQRDLRAAEVPQRVLHRPGDQRRHAEDPHLDPPVARAAPRAAGPDPGRARPPADAGSLMGFWDAVRGRRTTSPPTSTTSSGAERRDHAADGGSGSRRPARARSASAPPRARRSPQTQTEVVALLEADPDTPEVEVDHRLLRLHLALGRARPARRRRPLHRPARGQHGPGVAGLRRPDCSARWCPSTHRAGRASGLVYLYKQGTFYPFAPTGGQQRDNLLELQVRDALAGELPIEQDLSRWLAVWGAPGL